MEEGSININVEHGSLEDVYRELSFEANLSSLSSQDKIPPNCVVDVENGDIVVGTPNINNIPLNIVDVTKKSYKFNSSKQKKANYVKKQKSYSQPNPHHPHDDNLYSTHSGPLPNIGSKPSNYDLNGGDNEGYAIFRTKAPLLERRFSRLNSIRRGRRVEGDGIRATSSCPFEPNAERYFSALQGPELDVLKESEDTLLSVEQKWPFLLRFPIGCFGICLGLASQSILWKSLSTTSTMLFMHIPSFIHLTLWCLALLTFISVFSTYALKCLFYFEAVRREFYHPVRTNFFFAPWIACMFLALGAPPHAMATTIHSYLWITVITPVFVLELKMYGQWLSGGKGRLSEVVNPSSQLSLLANFVGALLAASVDWIEVATFFWAVGLAHYVVLFVTLYQRLPTAAVIPKDLHPVFFLFVAAPSSASVAWAKIVGDFDLVSRITYFIGLFLYLSLVVRINFFRGFRFSITWWAYTSPMTSAAIATIQYSLKVRHHFTQFMALVLACISSITVLLIFILTILHIFYWRDMFPNDVAIAITNERRQKKWSEFDPELNTTSEVSLEEA